MAIPGLAQLRNGSCQRKPDCTSWNRCARSRAQPKIRARHRDQPLQNRDQPAATQVICGAAGKVLATGALASGLFCCQRRRGALLHGQAENRTAGQAPLWPSCIRRAPLHRHPNRTAPPMRRYAPGRLDAALRPISVGFVEEEQIAIVSARGVSATRLRWRGTNMNRCATSVEQANCWPASVAIYQ